MISTALGQTHQVAPPVDLTWEQQIAAEPRLLGLDVQISTMHVPCELPTYWSTWADIVKPRIERLCGWYGESPELRSSAAYDAAVDHFWDLYQRRALECLGEEGAA